jgi:hypothetical protein
MNLHTVYTANVLFSHYVITVLLYLSVCCNVPQSHFEWSKVFHVTKFSSRLPKISRVLYPVPWSDEPPLGPLRMSHWDERLLRGVLGVIKSYDPLVPCGALRVINCGDPGFLPGAIRVTDCVDPTLLLQPETTLVNYDRSKEVYRVNNFCNMKIPAEVVVRMALSLSFALARMQVWMRLHCRRGAGENDRKRPVFESMPVAAVSVALKVRAAAWIMRQQLSEKRAAILRETFRMLTNPHSLYQPFVWWQSVVSGVHSFRVIPS